MFKKPSDVRGQQRLSGADRKKLRRNIRDKFPGATDEQLDAILPPKADVAVTRLVNRVLVYGLDNGLPMLFDCDGRGTEIYPTVFALWLVPDLLPSFLLKGGEVSRYVLSGADLMAPGVQVPAEGLPGFRPGEVWSVKVPGNSCPIAVGITMVGSAEAVGAGMRGKLLRITHYYRDSLCPIPRLPPPSHSYRETAEGSYVPNRGFLPDLVVPDPDAPPASSEGAAPEDSPDDAPDDDLGATGAGGGEGEAGRASTLWSNHVLPCRPPGTTVDIKKSSHKKLSKWLHARAVEGLISGREDKHRKEFILSAVNYRHPTLIAFTPDKTNKPAQTPAAATQDTSPAAPGAPTTTTATTTTTTTSSGSGSSSSSGGLTVEEVFKPTHHVSAIFEAVGLDPHAYYSPSAAREAALSYISLHSLTKPSDPSIVILDAPLCDALYKGAIKKGAAYPTECHKRDVGPTIVKRMQAHHRVERAGKSVVRKGGLVPVQILVERRQGNKKVTRVSGLEAYLVEAEPLAAELQRKFASSTSVAGREAYLVEAEPLAAELQRKFASSTSVTEVPGKKGQHEVLIQGGVLDELARLLVDVHGIPKSHIEVLDKTRR
ncbi:unnamed protein product [Closterium sp. Naga37s-1]|nr:unnamed protein product [Closterium sp. Naga37s-1]